VLLFILAFFLPAVFNIALLIFAALVVLLLLDMVLLYGAAEPLSLERRTPVRFSNGDDNEVRITLGSRYRFPVALTVMDELPFQFQLRDHALKTRLKPGAQQECS